VSALRWRQLAAAGPSIVRAVRWQPVPAVTGAVLLLLWWRDESVVRGSGSLWLLRAVALALAAAVPFALDDRSRRTVAAAPTGLAARTLAVLGLAVVPAAAVWAGACAWVAVRTAQPVPVAALTLEAGATTAAAVAVALVLVRWREVDDPGALTAPLVLALGLLLPRLPTWAALVTEPGPGWTASHLRWTAVLALAVGSATVAMLDPGRGRAPLRRLPWRAWASSSP
jgi:fluoroquinolone transport system permease protein